jgi:hypothetical protein
MDARWYYWWTSGWEWMETWWEREVDGIDENTITVLVGRAELVIVLID